MKRRISLLIGIILIASLGWVIGFLRLPYIEKHYSFWVGFIAALALVLFVISLLFVWNKNSLLVRLIGKEQTTKDSKTATRIYASIWILVSMFIILGGLVSSLMIYRQNELFKKQTQNQNNRIKEQSEMIESVRKSSLVFLMGNVLDNVDDELKNHPDGRLSDATIARIAALSYSFKPYRYFEGDSLSKEELSPERGQLLLALSIMNIDSISFSKIKLSAPFSGADLRGANLKGADLSGADLKGANLKDANLIGTNLNGADLKGANLWGANLNKADLSGADMIRSDLRWAVLNEADLKLANLDGADLTSAQLRKADLRWATFQWAELGGAMLNEANLTGGDLFGSALVKVNFTKANLTEVRLRKADFSEAILAGTVLIKAEVEGDWLEKLNKWQVTGAKEIQESYQLVDVTAETDDVSRFNLVIIED